MSELLFRRLLKYLPAKFIYLAAIQVIVEATTGKYENTNVSEIPAVDAIDRFCRIHGIRGHGKDEFYDSNRGETND